MACLPVVRNHSTAAESTHRGRFLGENNASMIGSPGRPARRRLVASARAGHVVEAFTPYEAVLEFAPEHVPAT